MISSLLLGLAVAGQCGPAGCSYMPRLETVALPTPIIQAPALDWGWHQIIYEDRVAWAWGYHVDPFTIQCYQLPDPIPQPREPIPQAPDPIPQPACKH